MGELVLFLMFAGAALVIGLVCMSAKGLWRVAEAFVGWVRHELLMRPKSRYYRW